MRELAAAFRNQPPMWLSTASLKIRSRPILACRTCVGTFPLRKPGILAEPARSEVAWSTACLRSACGTSTVSRTRLSASSSTWVAIAGPFKQTQFGPRSNAGLAPGSVAEAVERHGVVVEDAPPGFLGLRRLELLRQHLGERLPPPGR